MKFTDCLKRYHISPLNYNDGTELDERDYLELYKMLHRYFEMKELLLIKEKWQIDEYILDKIRATIKNSLIPMEEQDVMDILMEQKTNIVI